ncbi:MAG: bifunctional hydroxymethylpyrimidine kinase/phosphomethylpyrimidine kinase [Rectinemataceae bacterium]|jgi:hydroxymethylpyrimidine/phosphomethylpyrimidine kinase
MKTALTIAGSDSGGGAGIQADLKTFAAHAVFGTSAITALTAQNTLGVQGVFEIPADFVGRQIDSIARDIGADAVKIGMIFNAEIIEVVAAKIAEYSLLPLVLDPVMVAKGGDSLLRDDAKEALIRILLPAATIVTPNLPEAEVLCGFAISGIEDMHRAARAILALGPKAVVVKGGHLADRHESVDVFFDGKDFVEFTAVRVKSKNTHGTGCTFSSAIAASLALGLPLREAVKSAKDYVSRIIAASVDLGIGHGHGPMNHMVL